MFVVFLISATSRFLISVLSRTEKGQGIFFLKKGTLHVEFTKKGT